MLILCGMLSAFGYSAFIQSPIPPSTSKNFFKDVNGDGKMDQVEIVFLGNLSREYLDSTVARLEIDWPDSNGISKTLSYPGSAIPFDSTHSNSIILDLSEKKNIASKTVLGLSSQTARIYFADSSQMPIPMREKISPIVESAYLSHHATGKDSLKVRFSEPVFESTPNADFLEYKHNGSIQTISATKVEWSEDHSTVRLIWNAGQGLPLPRDSVRILAGAVHDSSQNSSLENSPFAKISGAYPFQVRTNSLAYVDDSKSRSNIPIFERIFADTSAHRPLSSELGIAFDLGGKDFQEFVQEIAGISSDPVLPSDISIQISLRLYTNTGNYVTSVSSTTKCSDSFFPQGNCLDHPQTFFLKWNLMANDRSAVATGAYLAKIFVQVRYKDKTLWKSDIDKNSAQIWGIKRNSN